MTTISGKEIAQRLSNENPQIRDKAWNNTKQLILSKTIQNEDEMKEAYEKSDNIIFDNILPN
jgi:hypothetical protein